MASSAPRKFEWLVVVPDFPGALQKRLEVRSQHFGGLSTFVESGQFKTGGATLEEVPESDDPSTWKFNGSTIVVEASSKEEVIGILKSDVYAKEGVWDVDNAQIWPFKCAFRVPVPNQEKMFPSTKV